MKISKCALSGAVVALLALAAGTHADPTATGSVSGAIHGLKGENAAGVVVTLTPFESTKKPAAAGDKKKNDDSVLKATTDSDGKFKIDNVPAGPYNIRASSKGVGSVKSQVTVKAGEDFSITLQLKPGKKKA